MFSACGGIRTVSTPVLTAYFSVLGKGGGLFVPPPLEDCLFATGLTGSSARTGTNCMDLHIIGSNVADCQALT